MLQSLPHLASCSFQGCPVASRPEYTQQIRDLLPSLQILDGHKLAQRSTSPTAPSPNLKVGLPAAVTSADTLIADDTGFTVRSLPDPAELKSKARRSPTGREQMAAPRGTVSTILKRLCIRSVSKDHTLSCRPERLGHQVGMRLCSTCRQVASCCL